MFGMVPRARQTYNARTETVAAKPSFPECLQKLGQFCILPVSSFYEPSYVSGKPVRWEIADADGEPLGIAGIGEHKQDGPNGLPLLSFSMLTVNADEHPLMRRFHEPNDKKRMLVILQPDQYDEWLHCPVEEASCFFSRYPAERLVAHAAPKPSQARSELTL